MKQAIAVALSIGFSLSAAAADVKGVAPGMTLAEAKTALPGFTCQRYVVPGVKTAADTECSTGVSYGGTYAEMSILLARDRVGHIMVTGSNTGWSSIREGLIAKYGKPASVDKKTVTTMGGAIINSETLHWRFGEQTVDASMHVDAVNFGVDITSDAYTAEDRRAAGPRGKDM